MVLAAAGSKKKKKASALRTRSCVDVRENQFRSRTPDPLFKEQPPPPTHPHVPNSPLLLLARPICIHPGVPGQRPYTPSSSSSVAVPGTSPLSPSPSSSSVDGFCIFQISLSLPVASTSTSSPLPSPKTFVRREENFQRGGRAGQVYTVFGCCCIIVVGSSKQIWLRIEGIIVHTEELCPVSPLIPEEPIVNPVSSSSPRVALANTLSLSLYPWLCSSLSLPSLSPRLSIDRSPPPVISPSR